MKSKTKQRTILIVVTLILGCTIVAFLVFQKNNTKNKECFDIIGDGYAMGTDPEPVIIGNSCDKPAEIAD